MIVQSAVLVLCGLEICLGLPTGKQFLPAYKLPPQFLDHSIEMDNTDAMILKNFHEPRIPINAKEKNELEDFFKWLSQNQAVHTTDHHHHHHPTKPNTCPEEYLPDPLSFGTKPQYSLIPNEGEVFVPPVNPVHFESNTPMKDQFIYQSDIPFITDPFMLSPSGHVLQRMPREVMNEISQDKMELLNYKPYIMDLVNEIKNQDMALIEKNDAKEPAMPSIESNSDSSGPNTSPSLTSSVEQVTIDIETKPDKEEIESPVTDKPVEFDDSKPTWKEWLKYMTMSTTPQIKDPETEDSVNTAMNNWYKFLSFQMNKQLQTPVHQRFAEMPLETDFPLWYQYPIVV